MTQSPTPGRAANGRFAAGNSGRPKGARNRASLGTAHEEMRLLNVLTFAFLHRHYPEAYDHLTRSLAAAQIPVDLRPRRKNMESAAAYGPDTAADPRPASATPSDGKNSD